MPVLSRILVLVGSLTVAVSAQAQIAPYEWVNQAGRNNLIDSNASSCDAIEGCYTNTGERCAKVSGEICDLQTVPEGRCTYGDLSLGLASCVWPHGAGHCALNPKVGCLSDAYRVDPANTASGPSFMCSGLADGACDMTTDPFGAAFRSSCLCQGTDPPFRTFEDRVCGGMSNGVCSDGDPDRLSGGYGLAFGWQLSLNLTPTGNAELGPAVNGSSVPPGTSPRYPIENPPTYFDAQRDAGTIGRIPTTGIIRPTRTTDARRRILIYPTLNVDTWQAFGNSYWSDWTFNRETSSFGNEHVAMYPCDIPVGWTVGSQIAPSTYCHDGAHDQIAVLWNRDLTPAELDANPTCPPNCKKDLDLTSLEYDAIRAIADLDANAGAQLAIQSGEGRQAGAGDVMSFVPMHRVKFLIDGDARCRLGGWGNAPGFAGRCADGPTACDLARSPAQQATDCAGQGGSCRACNGPYNAATNPLGLPIGYDTHGLPELDLIAGQRIGLVAGLSSEIVTPILLIGTSGAAAAEFRDAAFEGGNILDLADLGRLDTFGPPWGIGIGEGGTFTNGDALPLGMNCCANGDDLSWSEAQPGEVYDETAFLRTYDSGPGPDGIPACIGDNSPLSNGVDACNQRLGVGPILPGFLSTGVDDVPETLLLEGPSPVPVSRARFLTRKSVVCTPNAADIPAFNQVTALALRDLDVLLPKNADAMLKYNVSYCPIVGGIARCHEADCPAPDSDGDSIPDAVDNCPSTPNTDQLDGDADAVGTVCDNCTTRANARVAASFLATNAWATLTGGQRDDDHDGFGNKCDAKFPGVAGVLVGPADLTQFRASSGKNRTADVCGTIGTRPCAIFDLDEAGLLIGPQDLTQYRLLSGKTAGPRCATCPLVCEAGPQGNCF